jgi:hypothetical protein
MWRGVDDEDLGYKLAVVEKAANLVTPWLLIYGRLAHSLVAPKPISV